jgi:transcriptional antiterminator Rof (Rho-off)
MDEAYKPLSCELIDFLEVWASQKRRGEIVYFSSEATRESIMAGISTWVSRSGTEYLVLDSGGEIRLDRLITVFGVPFRRDEGISSFC